MAGQTVTFDGNTLNDLFFVGTVSVELPEFAPELVDLKGNGSAVLGTRMGGPSISIRLVAKPARGRRRERSVSTLLSWLDVDGPRWLTLSRDGGLRRWCVPMGAPTNEDADWNDSIVVTFRQVDPALFGATRTATIPSAGTVTVDVGGDYPTEPTIAATSAVRRASDQLWGVTLDNADSLLVKVDTPLASAITIDCGARTCVVGTTKCVPTLESDWWALTPGEHTLTAGAGTGAATVTWVERWHR